MHKKFWKLLVIGFALIITGALAGSAGGLLAAANAPQTSSTSDGVYSKAQSDRGKTAYGLNCAACHGADLSGDPAMQAPALTGDDFMKDWMDKSVDDLFDRIRTTMPANSPGSVADDALIDIVAYLLDANRFPAGDAELKVNRDALKTLMITRK